jgi:eukaryotic-like serine/threonine-protein kinase
MIDAPQSREAILEEAQKITSSALFENAGRSRALLDYLIREAVSGRADRLKEYTIGSEGLGRGDSFDPRTDTIVRAEASRLRSRLERYYAAEGKADPLVIVLPKGTYVLEFHERNVPAESATILPPAKPKVGRTGWVAVGAAVLGLIGFFAWKWNRASRPLETPVSTFEVELKAPGIIGSVVGTDVVISPDGTRLVFASQASDGVSRLSVHRLDRSQTQELPGTEGARAQFFSPDGGWVGFWAGGRLKKTALDGGSPVVLCEAADLQGASWAEDDSIIAALGDRKLWRIPASGGTPTMILDTSADGRRPSAPQVLKRHNAILFTLIGGDPAQYTIAVHSLSTGKTKVIAKAAAYGRYVPPGYLTYVRQGTLYGTTFDVDRLETPGTAVPILDRVSYDSTFGLAQLDFSQTGTLVYRKKGGAVVQWLDETGRTEPIISKAGYFIWPRLSPSGSRLAITTIEGGVATVWIHDLGTRQVRSVATGPMHFSLWSPDGRFLVLGGGSGLAWVRADQPSAPEVLTRGGIQIPASFTLDGSRLAFHALDSDTHFDLWTVPVQSSVDRLTAGQPEVLLRTPAIETYPTFSPDGLWMAYASSESGTWEVYVRSLPEMGKPIRVSTGGGRVPRWSSTSRELFYRTDNHKIMVAAYAIKGGQFTVEHVRPWSAKQLFDTGVLANYDVGRDGRIAALLPAENPEDRQSENHVTVTLGFFEEVRRRVSLRSAH